jgi:methionyl-tRNA formyltransferase
MEAGLDTGPMLLRETITIGSQTAGELHDVLAAQGARLIVQAMAQLSAGTLHETAQPEAGVTYASKLSKEEARLDFTLPAAELARRIQGYNPAPGAWAEIAGERIKLLHATALVAPANAPAGSVVQLDAEGLRIATGAGLLNITEAQRPGGRAQAISALYRHWPIAGKQFT